MRVRLLNAPLLFDGVVPLEIPDRPVLRIFRIRELLLDPTPEVIHEPQLRAAVALGIHRFVPPLQEALGVRERTRFLHMRRSRQEEDLRAYLLRLQLAGLYLWRVVPEGGRFALVEVAHHEPVE